LAQYNSNRADLKAPTNIEKDYTVACDALRQRRSAQATPHKRSTTIVGHASVRNILPHVLQAEPEGSRGLLADTVVDHMALVTLLVRLTH
jgi:hypothetical protein